MSDAVVSDAHVRLAIYEHFVRTAHAPSAGNLAANLGTTETGVVSAFHRLADDHSLVLRPGTDTILMAHPLSADPTGYETHIDGMTYSPNCGWDAMGIAAMIGKPARVTFRCPDCGGPIEFSIADGRLDTDWLRVHFAVPARQWWDDIAYT